MPRLNAGVVVGLCIAVAIAGFAVGRLAPARPAPVPELGAEIRAALREDDALARTQRTSSLLERLDPSNLSEVTAVYDELLPGIGAWDVRPFVAAWARFDPAAALEHVLGWPRGIQRQVGAEAALEGWARRDPSKARLAFEQAVAAHPPVEQRLVSGLVAGWAQSDQEGLEGFIAELEDYPREIASGVAFGVRLRFGGADAALGWADSILSSGAYGEDLERSVFYGAIRVVTRAHPERAAAWALEHVGSDYAEGAMRMVAEHWGGLDGTAALEWLRERQAGGERDRSVRVAFLSWLPREPETAEAWLASEPSSAFVDPALRAYAKRLEDAAPQEALGWCQRIVDAERQRNCLTSVAGRWYRRDAEAAEAWLRESPLDEEARGEARRGGKRRRRAPPGSRLR